MKEKDSKRISLDSKIKLIEDFLKEHPNEKIDGTTMYLDMPLGKMVIAIRSWVRTGRYDIDEKDIEKLQELGVLKSERDFLEDKIERLLTFVEKYPYIWYGRKKLETRFSQIEDLEEREKVSEEYQKVIKDYIYIYGRSKEKRLTEEQEAMLIKAGVGKLFVDKEDMQQEKYKLMEKYGISEESFDKILRRYGNLDSFRTIYIKALCDNEEKKTISEDLMSELHLIKEFDISKKGLVNNNDSYFKFFRDAYEIKDSVLIIDSDNIKQLVNEFLDTLDNREKEILQYFYGINGVEQQSLRNLEEVYKVSFQQLGNVRVNGLKRFRESTLFKKIRERIFILKPDNKLDFLNRYVEKKDVFFNEEDTELKESDRRYVLKKINRTKNDRILKNKKAVKARILNLDSEIFIDNELLNIKIADLDLSYRLNHYLRLAGINTVRDWLLLSEKQRNGIRHLGTSSIEMLNKKLVEIGITDCSIYEKEFDKNSKNLGIIEIIKRDIKESYLTEDDRKELVDLLKNKCSNLNEKNLEYILKRIEKTRKLIDRRPMEADDRTLQMPIEKLHLSNRAYNCLKQRGISKVKDWINLSEDQQIKIKNLGKKSYDEIVEKLNELELGFTNSGSYHLKRNDEKGMLIKEFEIIEIEIKNMYLDDETRAYLLELTRSHKEYICEKFRPILAVKKYRKPKANPKLDDELKSRIEGLKKGYKVLRSKKQKLDGLNLQIEQLEEVQDDNMEK